MREIVVVRFFLDPFVLLAVLVGIVLVSLDQVGSVPQAWWSWWFAGGAAALAYATYYQRRHPE
ncbi:MAG: hypothetical protein ACTHOG_01425 [Marmoricola sp.]